MTAKGNFNLQLKLMMFEKLHNTLHDIVLEFVNLSGFDSQSSSKVIATLTSLKELLNEPSIPTKKTKPSTKAVEDVITRTTRSGTKISIPLKEISKEKEDESSFPVTSDSSEKVNDVPNDLAEVSTAAVSTVAASTSTVLNVDENGSGSQRSKRLRLAPRRKTIFMSGLSMENNVETIKEYVHEILSGGVGENDINIFNISPKSYSTHTSFKVICPDSVYLKLLKVFREDGIVAREFKEQRAKETVSKNGVALPPTTITSVA